MDLREEMARMAYRGANRLVEAVGNLGITLDYSIRSLKDLERFLRACRKFDGPNTAVAVCSGLYLGEVLVQNIPGSTWQEVPVHLVEASLSLPRVGESPLMIFPVVRVNSYIRHPEAEGIGHWVAMLTGLAHGRLDPHSNLLPFIKNSSFE